ncbi:C25 family peptidase propeptide domain-containing protein, partial [Chitinispirillales bacterium ANBcel5]|uniref:C25 family peptidase propeptide domain-containing protein n=1 Tax=Cellulosispirillum alkaliphilum TaxID=3039283 RepID=UPI002A51C1B8|nr:C25 family peptidase propeptide domain-containing protein [Chitinispirillales bacterium ANBcel5]
MSKKILLIILGCVFSVLSSPVTVTEDSPSRLTFTFTVEEFDTATVKTADGSYTHLSFSGSNSFSSDSGEPYLPSYTLFIGVPQEGEIDVDVSVGAINRKQLNNPVKRSRSDGVSDVEYQNVWVSEPQYTTFRNYRAARVVVRPFQYDENSQNVSMLREATISVRFPPSQHRSSSSPGVLSDYNRMVDNLMVNFATARGWSRAGRLRKAAAQDFPFSRNRSVYSFKVGDGHSGFNEATTLENGIVKITGDDLFELFGPEVRMSEVALYASHKGEMDLSVPAQGQIPAGMFEIPLLRVSDDPFGPVESQDYALACVSGASDWVYNEGTNEFEMKINRYSDYRTYWLTTKDSPAREMETFEQPSEPVQTVDNFMNKVLLRRPQSRSMQYKEGGIDYIYRRFDVNNQSWSKLIDLPGLEQENSVDVQFVEHFRNRGAGDISASIGNNEICTNCSDIWFTIDQWTENRLSIDYWSDTVTIFYELYGIYFRYPKKLAAGNRNGDLRLEVFSDRENSVKRYSFDRGEEEEVYVFRIPQNESEASLIYGDTFGQTGDI